MTPTNKKKLKKMIEVMQAHLDGKPIQCIDSIIAKSGRWQDVSNPRWSWDTYDYRVKPEVVYKPLTPKQAVDYLGKDIYDSNGDLCTINSISQHGVEVSSKSGFIDLITFEDLTEFTFDNDGGYVGIRVEK